MKTFGNTIQQIFNRLNFRDLSIKHKLTLIITLISTVALFLAFAALIWYEVTMFRNTMVLHPRNNSSSRTLLVSLCHVSHCLQHGLYLETLWLAGEEPQLKHLHFFVSLFYS